MRRIGGGAGSIPACMKKMGASSMLRVLVSFLVLIASVCVNAQVPVNPNMRSFSSAVKGGHLPANQEVVLYESNTGEPGVVTEQWFTGKSTCRRCESACALILTASELIYSL